MDIKNIAYLNCKKISHPESRSASFKVYEDIINNLFDGDMWPLVSKIRQYRS